jgi:hypothetical protein
MAAAPGRAIMQFNSTQACLEGDEALVNRALGHSAWSSLAYEQSLFHLPPKDLAIVGL